jgi:hypothetical protein
MAHTGDSTIVANPFEGAAHNSITAAAVPAPWEVSMFSVRSIGVALSAVIFSVVLVSAGCSREHESQALSNEPSAAIDESTPATVVLSDEQLLNLVQSTYPFVAMYNVNNKAAMDPANPMNTGGWNRVKANTTLLDHTMQAIARPNN